MVSSAVCNVIPLKSRGRSNLPLIAGGRLAAGGSDDAARRRRPGMKPTSVEGRLALLISPILPPPIVRTPKTMTHLWTAPAMVDAVGTAPAPRCPAGCASLGTDGTQSFNRKFG